MNVSEMQIQRDQALACMILALCVSAAVFLSVFGKGDRLAVLEAKGAVAIHESLLRDTAKVLKQNQDALSAEQAALQAMENNSRR
jgi:hypothetical protein